MANEDYQTLLRNFAALNAQLQAFLNMNEETDVSTEAGTIPSLRKVINTLEKVQYIQKVKPFKTFNLLQGASSIITEEDLCQVTNDPDSRKNGLYRKFPIVGFNKVNYASLYDLGKTLPTPWNYDVIELPTQVDTKTLYNAVLEKSDVVTRAFSLEGKIIFTSLDGLYVSIEKFIVDIVMFAGNDLDYSFKSLNLSVFNRSLKTITPPTVIVGASSSGDADPFQNLMIGLDPAFELPLAYIPGKTEISFQGLDADIFKRVVENQ